MQSATCQVRRDASTSAVMCAAAWGCAEGSAVSRLPVCEEAWRSADAFDTVPIPCGLLVPTHALPVQGGLASPGPRSHGVSSRFHGEGPYMAWVGIVVIVALLQYFGFGLAVARARGRYQCPAPATTGHEMFERYYRVQMNTLEQLVL